MAIAFLALVVAGCAGLGGEGSGRRRGSIAANNEGLIRRYFDQWANHGSVSAADELISPEVVLRNPPSETRGLEAYKRSMAGFHAAFPDLHFQVEELVVQGNRVVARWTLAGTQQTGFQGRPAAGQQIAITGMSLFHIKDGRIQEIWVNMDRLGMRDQLDRAVPVKNLPAIR